MIRLDVAGTSQRFSASGIRFSPVLRRVPAVDVFSAFLTPEMIPDPGSRCPTARA